MESEPEVTDSEQGSVTVELAMMLPAVAALAALIIGLGSAAVQQLQLHDAARAGARAAALGQSDSEIGATAGAAAGRAVTVDVERNAGLVTVRCRGTVWLPLLGGRNGEADAVAACEPARGCG
ncbi:MAG: pilus assembly protein [Bifidobacteriaceae bacterium]|nr:pilus assembly protein [Bifidobacteriaceae bacterium]